MSLGRSLLIGCLWTCPAVAGDALDLVRWAPPDSYLVVAWEGADAAAPAFQRSQLGQLWAEPQFNSFVMKPFAGLRDMLEASFDEEMDDPKIAGLLKRTAKNLWRRPGVICVFPAEPDDVDAEDWPVSDSIAVVWDMGPDAGSDFSELVEADQDDDEPSLRETIAGTEFIKPQDAPAYLGCHRDRWIFAVGRTAVGKIVQQQQDGQRSFADMPVHTLAVERFKGIESIFYVNLQTSVARERVLDNIERLREQGDFEAEMDEKAPYLVAIGIGMAGLSANLGHLQGDIGGRDCAAVLGFEGDHLRTASYARADREYPLASDFACHTPMKRDFLRLLPANPLSATVMTWDPSAIYRQTLATAEKLTARIWPVQERPATEKQDTQEDADSPESQPDGDERRDADSDPEEPASVSVDRSPGWLERRITALAGLDIHAEVLSHLGPNVAFYQTPEFAGASLSVLFELRDAAAFERQLAGWLKLLPAPIRFKARKVGGRELQVLDLSGLGVKFPPLALSPCYAIVENVLFVSTSVAAGSRFLSQIDMPPAQTLVGREDIQKFLAAHESETLTSITLADERASFQVIYPQLALFYPLMTTEIRKAIQQESESQEEADEEEDESEDDEDEETDASRSRARGSGAGSAERAEHEAEEGSGDVRFTGAGDDSSAGPATRPSIEFAPIPDFDVFHRHMLTTISYATLLEDGTRLRYGRGGVPIAGGAAGVAGAAMGVAILLPSLARARELSKRTVCAANLKAISTAMYEHANEHDDEFPASLKDMLAKELVTGKTLICPSSEDTEEDKDISYVWIAGQTSDVDQRNVVAYEPKDNHGGEGANVLFADGHVEFVKPYEKVEALVEETKKRLAAQE